MQVCLRWSVIFPQVCVYQLECGRWCVVFYLYFWQCLLHCTWWWNELGFSTFQWCVCAFGLNWIWFCGMKCQRYLLESYPGWTAATRPPFQSGCWYAPLSAASLTSARLQLRFPSCQTHRDCYLSPGPEPKQPIRTWTTRQGPTWFHFGSSWISSDKTSTARVRHPWVFWVAASHSRSRCSLVPLSPPWTGRVVWARESCPSSLWLWTYPLRSSFQLGLYLPVQLCPCYTAASWYPWSYLNFR